jgi:iron(III) transport system substrate-binding protein
MTIHRARLRPGVRRGAVAAVAVMTTVGLAGCGQPISQATNKDGAAAAQSTQQPWSGLTGQAREKALLEAAQQEGVLSVYSGYNDEKSMAEAFTKKYGIKVEVYNANSESVLQRVLQESKADKPQNDVLINPSPDMQVAQTEGVLGHYDSEYRDAISDKGKGDLWTGVRRLAFVAGWNTGAAPTSSVPSDYSGFADPSWKGRISLELSDVDWYATVRQYYLDQGRSEQDLATMFHSIASNAKVVKGHTVQGDLMAAGQFDVALSVYSQTIERLLAKGAPVSYGVDEGHIVSPVVVRYDAGGVMGKTDNPAGAALYLDFQLSEPGFAVDQALGSLPPIAQGNEPLAKATIVELDVPTFVKDRTKLAADYEKLLRAGAKTG